jgi:hypothetical protein
MLTHPLKPLSGSAPEGLEWPALKTTKDLARILTTWIWVASCQHSAVNFNQYDYSVSLVCVGSYVSWLSMSNRKPRALKLLQNSVHSPHVGKGACLDRSFFAVVLLCDRDLS